MAGNWQVGIDIGGTFTDVLARDPARGVQRSAKVATRLDDRVSGLLAALKAVSLDWAEVGDLILGTTMITNAIVENDLADVALIATEGFSDTLAIGRQNRRHLYHLAPPAKLAPQVPASHRFEIKERMDHEGNILVPLDMVSVNDLIEKIAQTGCQAIAVCLLHSYANPAHEESLGKALGKRFPYVALSHQINPEAREFERTATTVLSACTMPLAASQLDRLEEMRPEGSRLHLFHSAGGMASPAALRDHPLGLAMSGPAAGVAAASELARNMGIGHAISFDMGGTTTDVCLITDGHAVVSSDLKLGGRLIRQPMVAVTSIGAGGGSIARLDHGALVVGPESAGAVPGPACYGKGGAEPTVSDANLVLGYLDADRVLGGALKLGLEAAQNAIAPLAAEMGMTLEEAAAGILRVANATMVRALRRVTVEQGIDGRDCTLLAFGGAGPMHAVQVAREFGISRVVVPANSSMFSALGCVSADMSYTRQQTLRLSSLAWDTEKLEGVQGRMRATLTGLLQEPLQDAGRTLPDLVISEVAMIRYRGQSYAIEITNPAFDDPAALGSAFQSEHNRLYGFATDEPWELQSIRMTATLAAQPAETQRAEKITKAPCPLKITTCRFEEGNASATPRFARDCLMPEQEMPGPLVVEDAFSTVIVPPRATVCVDKNDNLVIETGGAP